jgi:A/G-specific adenine glycosylase
MNFSQEIITWYHQNKRDLPWRKTQDPYKIWLSEIILQQTKVEQGLPYYTKFCAKYPKIQDLAKASEEDILKNWQGLGYYSRARNLHFTAKKITNDYQGIFPKSHKEILKLKGIGEYTAAAIASFAFKLPYAVVDGNVFRLLSRYFGIEIAINSSEGKKIFQKLSQTLLDKNKPDLFNQAIMEFGAIQCKPKKPQCESCVLSTNCEAFNNQRTEILPFKIKNSKKKEIFMEYFFLEYKSKTFLRKRTEKGIWQNLYEFPALEFNCVETEKNIDAVLKKKWLKDSAFKIIKKSERFNHILSHRKINARIWKINLDDKPKEKKWKLIELKKINRYPMSRLMELFLESKIFKSN